MSSTSGLILLDDVRPEHHNWIWADRIARKEIHFIAGKPDMGKGQMLAKIGADVSWGRDAWTGELGAKSALEPKQAPLKPMNILYSSMEDGYGTMMRPRLDAQGFRPEVDLAAQVPAAARLRGAGRHHHRQADRPVHLRPAGLEPVGRDQPLRRSDQAGHRPAQVELLQATNAAALFVDHVRKHVGINADPLQAVGGASSAASRPPAGWASCSARTRRTRTGRCSRTSSTTSGPRPMAIDFEIDTRRGHVRLDGRGRQRRAATSTRACPSC